MGGHNEELKMGGLILKQEGLSGLMPDRNVANWAVSLSEVDAGVCGILSAENQMLRSIAAHSQALVGAKNLDGRYLYVNSAYERLFKKSADGLIGHFDRDFMPESIAQSLRMADVKAQSHPEGIQMEESVEVDGVIRHFLSTKFPIFDEQRRLLGTGVIAHDISDKRKAIDELRRLATTDYQTGAMNHRTFCGFVETELDRSRRYGYPLSLVMFDLDNFKKINDNYGHGAGDLVIGGFSSLVQQQIRETDGFGRMGGEEFAALLPHSTTEQAAAWAQRVRQQLRQQQQQKAFADGVIVTFSAGIAEFSEATDSVESLLHSADMHMYRAKHQGRDRICYKSNESLKMEQSA